MAISTSEETRILLRLTDLDTEALQADDQDIGDSHTLHRYQSALALMENTSIEA